LKKTGQKTRGVGGTGGSGWVFNYKVLNQNRVRLELQWGGGKKRGGGVEFQKGNYNDTLIGGVAIRKTGVRGNGQWDPQNRVVPLAQNKKKTRKERIHR